MNEKYNNDGFNESFDKGKIAEKYVLNKIKEKYPDAYIIDGYYKQCDIIIPEILKSIEVKLDRESMNTGNILIETSCKGKPSGLITTKADFWVIIDTENMFWIEPIELMKIILYHNFRSKEISVGKDNYFRNCYFLKKNILIQFCSENNKRIMPVDSDFPQILKL